MTALVGWLSREITVTTTNGLYLLLWGSFVLGAFTGVLQVIGWLLDTVLGVHVRGCW